MPKSEHQKFINNMYSFNNNDLIPMSIVADVLGVSKKTIVSWAKNSKLIPYIENNKYFYSVEQLIQFPQFYNLCHSTWDRFMTIEPNQPYTLVELFAGAGGLALGLEKAGFNSILLNEKDKRACETLRINRPQWNILENDIANVDFKQYYRQIDLLTGGFPCQPFSQAGKQLGLNDIRGTLVFEMARAIQEIQPKIFLAENVKGLQENDKGRTLKVIQHVLENLGYTLIENKIYQAMFYKVPQKRERLILIGIRNDLFKKDLFKSPSYYHSILTVKDALKAGKLYVNDVPDSQGQSYSINKQAVLSQIPQGGYWKDLPLELQKSYLGSSFYAGGGKTGMARRLAWDEPSLTLTCSPAQKQTDRCHPIFNRPLTIREYARIQTFPDDWQFYGSISQIYAQIGNAVPVNMATAIGKSLINTLNNLSH